MKNVTTKQLEEMFTKYKSKLWSHKEEVLGDDVVRLGDAEQILEDLLSELGCWEKEERLKAGDTIQCSDEEKEQIIADLMKDGYLVFEEFSPIVGKHIIHITKDLKIDLAPDQGGKA